MKFGLACPQAYHQSKPGVLNQVCFIFIKRDIESNE